MFKPSKMQKVLDVTSGAGLGFFGFFF